MRGALHLDLRLLHFIDLGKNFAERVGVGRPEVLAICDAGYFAERLLVEFHEDISIDRPAEGVLERKRRLALGAGSDRVDADAESFGGLGGGEGLDLAGVVVAVCQKND